MLIVCLGLLQTGARAEPAGEGSAARQGFVEVSGAQFVVNGEPYRFVGVNMWYGAYLGAPAPYGDRARLIGELDQLKALGVDNLRVLGASERSPFRKSLSETFRTVSDDYNAALIEGLDFLLAEMARRDMRAVIYLNNFWEWSGGMGTYLYWTNGGRYVDLGDPAHPWPAFQNHTAEFYNSEAANALYREYIRAIVGRVNAINGRPYRDDPTVMSWQLANEPRPGAGEAGLASFYRWIDETARFIKSLDANHLVSTGNEGFMGCNEVDACFVRAHRSPDIDYATFHLWPRNWGWFDPARPDETFEAAAERALDYIERHAREARSLGKPAVLEEFGLDRDFEALEPGAPVQYRNALLRAVYDAVESDIAAGGALAGTNVWSWGGQGRAAHGDFEWRPGDVSFTGDPPQEPQGRNSIFDVDDDTLAIMKEHASRLRALAGEAKAGNK